MRRLSALLWPCLLSFAASAPAAAEAPRAEPLPLPGTPGKVVMDYLAYDAATSRVWVPAGNTGRVDVLDTRTLAFQSVSGFPTAQRGERLLGPSSATVGDGYVYVGNRANAQVCPISSRTLKRATCVTLTTPPDGVAYVAPTHEVWVTTPRDQSLTLLDVSKPAVPRVAQVVRLPGEPEGYAVDAAKGRFYTNLEDKDQTLAFDVKTRAQVARYSPGCGAAGPRGLALDAERQLLVVACTDHLAVLRLDKNGERVATLPTGAGLDNIDYDPARHTVYAAGGKSANLTLATLGPDGKLTPVATVPTAPGTRVVVVDKQGQAFVADSTGGKLWRVAAP